MRFQKRFERDENNWLKHSVNSKMIFGIIVGNRSGKVNSLVDESRNKIIEVLRGLGYELVCLTDKDTPSGSVGSVNDAKKCAELFKKNSEKIDGIIVTLPNFGDERGIANTIRWSELNVPVLIQAEPDDLEQMGFQQRRDSFCGKISVCANLKQYNIPFTLTKNHTCAIGSEEFAEEVSKFSAICRIVNGMRRARIGAIGVRPASFNTVRYSEKILEHYGVSVEPIDLSEILGKINNLDIKQDLLVKKIDEVRSYIPIGPDVIPNNGLEKIAKLLIVLEDWIETNDIDAIAFQCWTAIEQFLGIAPCGALSMLTHNLIPSACEVDVMGALTMLIMEYASLKPSIILDWDNNYGNNPNKCVVFHCSNIAKDFLENPKLENHFSLSFVPDRGFGAVFGKIKANEVTFARLSTNDNEGKLQFYAGNGKFTDDKLETFGGYGVFEVEGLQKLMYNICECGLEHHFVATIGNYREIITEALENYFEIKQPSQFV